MIRSVLFMLMVLLAGCSGGDDTQSPAASKNAPAVSAVPTVMQQTGPVLKFEPDHIDLGSVSEGDNAVVYLRVRNAGNDMAQIVNVETSCGCSVAEPEEHILMPGSFTRIRVTIDTFAKQDDVSKWVVITDAKGNTSKAWLTLEVKANPHLMVKGRTIFDGQCGSCHFTPAAGKTRGPDIYAAVCGMCHGPQAEGGVAPALRGQDADALNMLITHGTGSQHMPAYGVEHGGPLSRNQVSVLSQWLSKLDAEGPER